ncbi:MAG: hypothetical protein WD379_10545 [Dehalococcoidia bacterium]
MDCSDPAFAAAEITLHSDAKKGDTVLDVPCNEGVSKGDSIVINPGGLTEEDNEVMDLGSIILAEPLLYDHAAGEPISVLPEGADDLDEGDLGNPTGFGSAGGPPPPDGEAGLPVLLLALVVGAALATARIWRLRRPAAPPPA